MKFLKFGLALFIAITTSFFLSAFVAHGLSPAQALECGKEELMLSQKNNTPWLRTRCQLLDSKTS